MSRKHRNHHLAALLGYGLLTVLFTYPTAFRLASHIPGEGDAPWFLWQLWWFKRAIVDLTRSPLLTDRIYYPLADVVANWQTPYNELIAIPLQAALGTVVAYNLLILSTFVLSGYAMYLLSWRVVRRRDLAFIGGLIYAYCAYRGMRGLHHLSLATTQWMPLALLLLINLWRRPGIRRGLAAGVGVGLVALSSPYYLAYFLAPVALTGALYLLIWRWPQLRRAALWPAAAVTALTAALMAGPFYLDYLRAPADLRLAAQEAAASIEVYTADVLSWLLPPRDNPLWQGLLAGIYDNFTDGYLVETTLFFGLLPLLLGFGTLLVRRLRRPPFTFWQILAATTFLLSFGPLLRIGGQTLISWMPYRLVAWLPGSYAFRVPARIGITAILAGTILTLVLLRHLLAIRPVRHRPLLLGLWSALLLVNMAVAFPYPSASVAVPTLYEDIAAAPGDRAVLELPGGELFLDQMSWSMYYQTAHGKPIVSGYLGRRPERLHAFERTAPFVRRFFVQDWTSYFAGDGWALVDWPPQAQILAGNWPADVRNAATLLDDLGIGHVVLHRDRERPGLFEGAALLLNLGLGPPVKTDGDAVLFAVPPAQFAIQGDTAGLADAPLAFDPAFSAPSLHLGSQARAVDPQADAASISTALPLAGSWSLRGALAGAAAADVAFRLDGRPVQAERVRLFDDVYGFRVRADLPAGEHTLALVRPRNAGAPSPQGSSCADLCLLNPIATLDAVGAQMTERPIRFVDEQGAQLGLLQAAVLPASGDAGTRLVTTWQLPSLTDWAALRDNPPTLFVHVTDGQGQIVVQADHALGENSLWLPGDETAGVLFDQVELPPATALDPGHQVRIGLWYPDRQAYFWLADGQADDPVRLTLGTVAELTTAARQED